jgi:XTP/dITP diphosphohydrolase
MNNRLSQLLVATHNKGKVAEYTEILGELQIEWLTLDEAGVMDEVEETGQTFLENAVLKAVAYARQTGFYTLADDSGLEVDYLNGQPGVQTARYGGTGLNAAERYELLLRNLAGIPWELRSARFRCVVALANPRGEVIHTAEGVCEGVIALDPAGNGGFGYDPVFYLPERGLTMAQLTPEEKHRISHRGRAAFAIAPAIRIAMNGG